jgi:glyoxylase-like metal-dependent hydrolase (beta-lactamase superfamily II)
MSWTRRAFLHTSSLAIAGGAWRVLGAAQQPPAPAGRFEPIRRNVGIFTARGGTIGWLIAPGAVVVVDTQYPDTAQICVDGIRTRTTRRIDAVINTHHHADHTGGNAVFQPLAARIVAHARVPGLQKGAAAAQTNAPAQAYADRTFEDTWQEQIGDEVLALKHFGPGHTGGDSVVTFERANVVHLGDLMFNRLHPRVDRPSGASIRGWIDQLGKIPGEHDNDTIYVFGHAKPGAPVTGPRAELAQLQRYFEAALDYVQAAIKAGKSKEEIASATELPGFTDYASSGRVLTLAGVLGVAYDELTQRL